MDRATAKPYPSSPYRILGAGRPTGALGLTRSVVRMGKANFFFGVGGLDVVPGAFQALRCLRIHSAFCRRTSALRSASRVKKSWRRETCDDASAPHCSSLVHGSRKMTSIVQKPVGNS